MVTMHGPASWRFVALLVATLLCCIQLSVQYEDAEVGASGNIISNHERKVAFQNLIADFISVYWISPDSGEQIKLFDIDAEATTVVNTYNGHKFVAYMYDDDNTVDDPVSPGTFEIYHDVETYYIGGVGVSDDSEGSDAPNREMGEAVVGGGSKVTRQHPGVTIMNRKSLCMSAKFKSLVPSLDIYFDGGRADWSYQGTLHMGKESTTASYEGHQFVFTETGNKSNVLARHTMKKDQHFYYIVDESNPAPPAVQAQLDAELTYRAAYLERTGLQWRSYFGPITNGPRPPPQLFMWPAKEVGQVHQVTSSHGYW